MGRKIQDLKGKKFGRLTPIEVVGFKYRRAVWKCKCDCGNIVNVQMGHLIQNNTSSCGCLRKDYLKNDIIKQLNSMIIENTNVNHIKSNRVSKSNKSGYKGIHPHKQTGKWVAQITFKKKKYYLGIYENLEDAVKARKEAEEKLHKEFLREKGLID